MPLRQPPVLLLKFFIVAILLFSIKATAQGPGCDENYFLKNYADADSSISPFDMVLTGNNDVIIAGSLYSSVPGASEDGFIVRLDNTGAKLWEITLTGPQQQHCRKIIRLRDNNFLVAGYDFQFSSFFLLKIDIDGNIIWRKNIVNTNPALNPGIGMIKEGTDGSIYMVSFYSEALSHGMLFSRCDNTGAVIYSQYYRVANRLNPIEIRDMVIKDNFTYVTGVLMDDSNPTYVYNGFLSKINNINGSLLWTKLYNYNNGPQIFQQIFDYGPGQLCLLGQNTINSSDLNNLLICDTAGAVQHLSYFQFGAYRQFGYATLNPNGNILYSNYLTGNGPVDLAMCLVNPYTGVQWAQHFPQLTPLPRVSKLLIADNNDIFSVGKYFPGKASMFVGKHSDQGEVGCISEPLSVNFGSGNTRVMPVNLANSAKIYSAVTGVAPPLSNLITEGPPLCDVPVTCTTLALDGRNSLCLVTDTLSLMVITDQGCLSVPEWIYDRSFFRLLNFEINVAKFIALRTGTSTITAEIYLACDTLTAIHNLNIWPNPEPELGIDTSLCFGKTRILNPGVFSSYLWQDGNKDPTYTVAGEGFYKVTVDDIHQCTASDSITINKIVPLPANFLPKDTAICNNQNIVLRALQDFDSYNWNTNQNASEIVITQPGIYWLEVTDKYQCKGRDSILINSKECTNSFFIPSAFTPDNNGRNDMFKPLISGNVKSYQFTIYNRWGEVVFSSSQLNKGWDGIFKGSKQDTNVFAWTCSYEFENSSPKLEKGTVMLIR